MISLLIGLSLLAQTHYPMHVVKEARVGQRAQIESPALACQNISQKSMAQNQLSWIGSRDRKPEFVLSIDKNSQIMATRNTDDAYLNSVTLWLSVRTKNKVQFYELTEINMQEYELPEVRLVKNSLIIKARTMKADPQEDNEFMMGLPTLRSELYQTLRITKNQGSEIQIESLVCIQ